MDTISMNSANTDTTQVWRPVVATTDACWCGQDLDLVRAGHCPRCGTARASRLVAHLPRLVA